MSNFSAQGNTPTGDDDMVEVPTIDEGATAAVVAASEPQVRHHGMAGLVLAAIGVVFGDIGTSPLYSMQTVFSIDHNTVAPTPSDVFGVISMAFWSITIVVSMKYVALVMRADNDGEGGILALVHLLREHLKGRRRLSRLALVFGMVGAALFYGDSVITPAISVMSAIEGLQVANPAFEELVLPLSIVILTALFAIQRWGTEVVGKAFGPVMVVWFGLLAVLGIPHIIDHPAIIGALLPHHAVMFMLDRPFVAFVALGAVVLTITGAEALYADMGHFGASPIRWSWFCFVFPALTLNYLGQGAMILQRPETSANPFFNLAPSWATIPLVVLATLATVIASQAVISGAFSVSRQATRLGMLPRLAVVQTSKHEGGQIYVPAINWILYLGVLLLIAVFGSSSRLANAYGLAVTGTLILTSVLFLLLARDVWHVAAWKLWVYLLLVGGLEIVYFSANAVKVVSGGWLPLLIAGVLFVVMSTWLRGHAMVVRRRRALEGSLEDFVERTVAAQIPRVPGLAVFPHPNRETTPLAMRSNVDFNRVLHEQVVIVSIVNENVPHIRHVERVQVSNLGLPEHGIHYVSCRVGFNDSQDVPKALALALPMIPELAGFTEADARYFLSATNATEEAKARFNWRRALYMWLSHNAADGATVLHLPPERTVVMGANLTLTAIDEDPEDPDEVPVAAPEQPAKG